MVKSAGFGRWSGLEMLVTVLIVLVIVIVSGFASPNVPVATRNETVAAGNNAPAAGRAPAA